MSYILEALKKAQAERQLGNAPTIHAPQPVQVNAATGGAAANRKPLLLGLGAGALVVLVGAALMWRHAPAPAPDTQKVAQTAQPATPSASGATSATLAVRAPDLPSPPPVAPRVAGTHAAPVAPAAVPAPRARVAGSAGVPAAPVAAVQPQPQPQLAPQGGQHQAPAAAAAPEDSLPLVQQLPEQIRSQIPRMSFGGYMYSANPADRLILVDNALRHEGEEVAPGLVLEKLMPKAAVMNFRGIRYRVAY
jgi:general secretion pathway protein B